MCINKQEETCLLGYWNGDKIKPEITFNQEEALRTHKKLYIIRLQLVPELGKENPEQVTKGIKRELKNLINTVRRTKP